VKSRRATTEGLCAEGVLVLELNRKCRALELITFNHIQRFTHLLYLYDIHVIDCHSHSIIGRVRESLAKTTKLAVTADAAKVHIIQD